MKILVLGAGVVGVTSAWYLAAAGHEVIVLDRQPAPARETSHANGGQISVSHAEPWANPGAPGRILRWIGREESPLLWRLRADCAQWRWGLQFLAECTAARAEANIAAIVRLGLYSRDRLRELRTSLGLDYDQLIRGILHFYSDPREYEHALRQAAVMRGFGCDRIEKTAAECCEIEPALLGSQAPIVGGTYTAGDESGDARRFTEALAEQARLSGVRFTLNTIVSRLESAGGQVHGVHLLSGEVLRADAYVVALGSYAPALVAPLGIRLPVYPAKGYSVTIPLSEELRAPTVSLTDDGYKLVFSRLGQRLRVAGTAEFAGHDLSINPRRCDAVMRRVREVFPDLAGVADIEYWAGLRPSTPSNVPVIGKTKVSNLWINGGHGTLGWTLACGSAAILADQMSGRTAEIDTTPYQR